MAHPLDKFKYCPICGSSDFKENDFKSKKCGDCGFTYYFNPSSSSVAFIRNSKGEIAVVRRAKEPAKGTLDLPGGFIDMAETAEEGLTREIMEETGMKVKDIKYLFTLPNIYPFSGFEVHTLDMFFECICLDDTIALAMDDAEDIRFIPLGEIDPLQFGLHSISKGVERYKEIRLNTKS